MADDSFVHLNLTRRQAFQIYEIAGHAADSATFEGSINGQPVNVRISAAEEAAAPPPEVVEQPERCPCKSGSARNPGTHNNQVRQNGRCYCHCHPQRR